MTEVAFHTGVPDKLGYACRLLRKAWRQGKRVVVVGAPDALGKLDQALWVFEQEEFVPHLRLRSGEPASPRMQRTPIWLTEDDEADVDASVLVNLGPTFPSRPVRFEKVVELVSTDVDDAQTARIRWKQYSAAGLAPVNRPCKNEGVRDREA